MNKKFLFYSERAKLAKEYEEWVNKPLEDGSKIKDCPLSVITFMVMKGFYKLPEVSVVLDRHEHQKYCAYKIIEPQIKGCLDRERELEKQVAELEEQRDRQAYKTEELIQEKHRWTEQARKETAKEILTEIWSKGVKSVTSTDNSKCFLEITYEKLKELAKQYGVEE